METHTVNKYWFSGHAGAIVLVAGDTVLNNVDSLCPVEFRDNKK